MRAAVITKPGGPDVLRVEDMPMPDPEADQVRVRVRTSSLNRADLLQRAGRYPVPPGSPASIPGLEIAGEVDAVGPDAVGVAVGDRVFGLVGGGGHAEYVITTPDLLAPIPPSLDWPEAGAVPEVWMTAYDALFVQAELSLGERVLVHAAGSGVGTAAIQLACKAGASVWGTARTDDKRRQALELGLVDALSPDTFAKDILAATAGAGVDVLLDFVGAPYLRSNLEALALRGRLVLIGAMGGGEGMVDLGVLMRKRLRVIGTVLRSRSRAEKAALTARFTAHVVPLLAADQVRPIIDRVFPLDAIAAAHSYMESNANFGKIVLHM